MEGVHTLFFAQSAEIVKIKDWFLVSAEKCKNAKSAQSVEHRG